MSSALEYLRNRIKTHTSEFHFSSVFDPRALDKEIELLRLKATSAPVAPPENQIARALNDFYRNLELSSYRQARLVSCGFVDAWGSNQYRLIEDSERFPRFLDCLNAYRPQSRAFRKCYNGLLKGYFNYDTNNPHAPVTGKRNWGALRDYLGENLRYIHAPGVEPDWVMGLEANQILLGPNPCSTYGPQLLNGNRAAFEKVKADLEISDSSWFMRQIILAQIGAATKLPDAAYIKLIPNMLDLLESHASLIGEGLPILIDRYCSGQAPSLHPELRDFSVAIWGNPWLAANQAKWSLVSSNTRAMVADWLKLHVIHRFFSLLAHNGQNDTRRLRFWQRYYKHINTMHFALGAASANNQSQDFRKVREEMRGLTLQLNSAGHPTNNAFIICMGRHVVVEFGLTGNACFIFEKDALPFPLQGSVAGDSTELKHESRLERLLHIDGNHEDWEHKFSTTLRRLTGFNPGAVSEIPLEASIETNRRNYRVPKIATAQRSPIHDLPITQGAYTPTTLPLFDTAANPITSPRNADAPQRPTLGRTTTFAASTTPEYSLPSFIPPAPRREIVIEKPKVATPQEKVTQTVQPARILVNTDVQGMLEWASKQGFETRDLRVKGGNLWIHTRTMNMAVNRQLLAWGFKYKDDADAWWRKR